MERGSGRREHMTWRTDDKLRKQSRDKSLSRILVAKHSGGSEVYGKWRFNFQVNSDRD